MGITIAIISSIFMATSQILLKKSYKELNSGIAFLINSILGLIIWIPIGLIFGGSFYEVHDCLIFAIISAIISELLVFYVLDKGDLSITTILISTYPIYTLLFSYIINNEILSKSQIVFIIITIIGTIVSCVEKNIKINKVEENKAILPILISIGIGLSDSLTKNIINKTSSFSFLLAIALVQIPIALIYLLLKNKTSKEINREMKKNIKEYKYTILGGLFNILGTGCLLISFNYALVAIVSPLTILYTPFVLIYSIIILKEKINMTRLIGLAISFIGTLGIIILG